MNVWKPWQNFLIRNPTQNPKLNPKWNLKESLNQTLHETLKKPQRNANPKESLNEIRKNPQMNPNSFSLLSPVCILNGYGSIPIDTFLVGWTSIYQLFWGSLGTRVLTHPQMRPWKTLGETERNPKEFLIWSPDKKPLHETLNEP